jgi:hypothetical protein
VHFAEPHLRSAARGLLAFFVRKRGGRRSEQTGAKYCHEASHVALLEIVIGAPP